MKFFRPLFFFLIIFYQGIIASDSYLKAHELKITSGNITFQTASSQSPSYGFFMSAPDSHYLNCFPSLGAGSYNPLTNSGDTGIIYSSGAANGTSTGLVIAPWSSSTVGIRITASGNVGINTATPQTLLSVNGTTYTHSDIHIDNNLIVSGNIQFGGNINPVGSIAAYSISSIPSGWLLCDGSAVSRTTYSSLFAIIGTTYGSGDGSTTFNLPNLTGRVPIGIDSSDSNMNSMGETGGRKTVSGTDLPSHYHSVPNHTHTYEDVYYAESSGTDDIGLGQNHRGSGATDSDNEDYAVTRTTVSGGPGNTNTDTNGVTNSTMNIMNPYLTLKYMIKY